MTPAAILLVATLCAPLLQALLAAALDRFALARDGLVCLVALLGAGAGAALTLHGASMNGSTLSMGTYGPGLSIVFLIEPLGAFMAGLIASLGAAVTVFSVGFARATGQRDAARRQAAAALSIAAALAAALSGNLATMFVAIVALTVASSALVAVGAEGEARRGALTYLGVMLAAAAGLLLPAIVTLHAVGDGATFTPGGVLNVNAPPLTVSVLLGLLVFGVAAAALAPMSAWVGASARAPAPVGALLHGVAVTPVGAFMVLKATVYVFGGTLEREPIGADVVLVACACSMLGLGFLALSKRDLRERLAYVCAAQAAGAVAAAMFASPAGVLAAMFQIYALAGAAALAFMAAGVVRAATGRASVEEAAGLGRVMPWTMAGFAIAVVSLVGLAPFAGAWGKFWLIVASVDAERAWYGVTAAVGAVVSFAALAVIAARAFSEPAPVDPFTRPDGGSALMVVPIVVTAALLCALVVMVDPINAYFAPIWEVVP
jgi:multicomponent Na+:H+ antiporter subunit D